MNTGKPLGQLKNVNNKSRDAKKNL